MRYSLKKHIAALVWICLVWLSGYAQIVPKTMIRLPDTGQTQSFTNTPGEDSDFEQNPPFFVVNGDGTATDMVTGLMWQQIDGGEMTIEAAEAYCQNLVLGGYSDWRMPTAQEAFSILNHGMQNPPLDLSVFSNSGAEYWWTSERQVGNPDKVWVTNAGGGIGNHPKAETISAGGTKKFHVRAVRDMVPPPMIFTQFTEADSIILDHLTGLEWQRFVIPDSMTWEDALVFAEQLELQGKSDWRLPNIKELESLNDETRSQPSVNFNYFEGFSTNKYWASTSLPNQTTQAWFMDTRFGVVSHEVKTTQSHVLCVRGHSGETTGVSSVYSADVRVYPNPFSSKIIVERRSQEGFENLPAFSIFQLFDGCGRLIFSGNDISEKDFSAWPPGVYFLKIPEAKGALARLMKI